MCVMQIPWHFFADMDVTVRVKLPIDRYTFMCPVGNSRNTHVFPMCLKGPLFWPFAASRTAVKWPLRFNTVATRGRVWYDEKSRAKLVDLHANLSGYLDKMVLRCFSHNASLVVSSHSVVVNQVCTQFTQYGSNSGESCYTAPADVGQSSKYALKWNDINLLRTNGQQLYLRCVALHPFVSLCCPPLSFLSLVSFCFFNDVIV